MTTPDRMSGNVWKVFVNTAMIVKLLTEHHLEFLTLKGGCRGSSESTLVKMPHCWKSHAAAHMHIVRKCIAIRYNFSESLQLYREWTSFQMVNFHKQRAITTEGMV